MDNNQNIKRFKELMSKVKREGINAVMDYIDSSDFYTAPASTKYHLSCSGGLLQHSLNVYDCMMNKLKNPIIKAMLNGVSEESLIICTLLHDICKTNFYTVSYRNAKNSDGKWEKVPYYTISDKIPYGHGEKSAMMIEMFMKLLPSERYAIRWHMGFTEPRESYSTLNAALEKYPLVLALMESDLEASNFIETLDGNKNITPMKELEFEECQ